MLRLPTQRASRILIAATAVSLAVACAAQHPADVTAPRAAAGGAATDAPRAPSGGALRLSEARFSELPGWASADHAAALAAFLATCRRFEGLSDDAPVGPAYAGAAGPWKAACDTAARLPPGDARAFFEAEFTPVSLATGEGEVTGLATAYYEPEIVARRTPAWPYLEPLVMRPPNLEVVPSPAYDTYARGVREEVFLRQPSGALTLAPPRGAIRRDAQPDEVIGYGTVADVVFLQIQGSGRLLFPDGTRVRAAYAATNGRPYGSIARHLAEAGVMPLEQASNARIKAWLDDAGAADADRIVNVNERYVFFQAEPLGPDPDGPRGAAGVPLTAHASIAVDPDWHAYGALLWIAPEGDGAPTARLAVAQDTGGAITGPLRADLFFGSGEAAGEVAARVRHPARWWAIVPNAAAAAVVVGAAP